MNWFNTYGLAIVAIIMIPNMIFMAKSKGGMENLWQNRAVEGLEQAGRIGCFGFMVVNLPHTCAGFWFDGGPAVYLAVSAVLVAAYCAIWAVCFYKNSLFRALALSILPSVLFLFDGVMIVSAPLIMAALVFAPCHIIISCKNALLAAGKSDLGI